MNATKAELREQWKLVNQLSKRYLKNAEKNIASRAENGHCRGWVGMRPNQVHGYSVYQMHEAAKMLRREILNLDKMMGW